jgi:hypothetical protein
MFGFTRIALDLAQTASEAKPARPRDNRPSARRARFQAQLSGPRPAGVTPQAWAALQKNLGK